MKIKNSFLYERTVYLQLFLKEFKLDVPEYSIQRFIKEHHLRQLDESKKKVKEAKKTLISAINNDVFTEILAKMKADKISKSELARRLNRTPQQIGKVLRSQNATLTTINNIKKAIGL